MTIRAVNGTWQIVRVTPTHSRALANTCMCTHTCPHTPTCTSVRLVTCVLPVPYNYYAVINQKNYRVTSPVMVWLMTLQLHSYIVSITKKYQLNDRCRLSKDSRQITCLLSAVRFAEPWARSRYGWYNHCHFHNNVSRVAYTLITLKCGGWWQVFFVAVCPQLIGSNVSTCTVRCET